METTTKKFIGGFGLGFVFGIVTTVAVYGTIVLKIVTNFIN